MNKFTQGVCYYDDPNDWDDETTSEQGNGQDSDNLPTWQQ